MQASLRPRSILAIGVMAVVVVLVLGILTTGSVSAALDACRGDPILYLSNGSTLTVTVDIATGVKDVQVVDYVITLPKDVTVVGVEKVNDKFAETVTIVYGAPAVYRSSVTIRTAGTDVAVSANMQLDGVMVSADGVSGQTLQLKVVAP